MRLGHHQIIVFIPVLYTKVSAAELDDIAAVAVHRLRGSIRHFHLCPALYSYSIFHMSLGGKSASEKSNPLIDEHEYTVRDLGPPTQSLRTD